MTPAAQGRYWRVRFLLLAVAGLGLSGLILARAERSGADRLVVVRMGLAAAAVISFFLARAGGEAGVGRPAAGLGAGLGILLFLFLLVAGRAAAGGERSPLLPACGLLLAAGAARVFPGWPVVAGGLVALAGLLAAARRPAWRKGWWWLAGGLAGLLGTGSALFLRWCQGQARFSFGAVLFVAGFAASTVLYYRGRRRVTRQGLGWGFLFGAVACGSLHSVLSGLEAVGAGLFFPFLACGTGLLAVRSRSGRFYIGSGLVAAGLLIAWLGTGTGF